MQTLEQVVLTAAHPVATLGMPEGQLKLEELKLLRRLVGVQTIPGKREILIKRNVAHRVGRCRVRNYEVIVPPELAAPAFVQLLLYALRANATKYLHRETVSTAIQAAERGDFFIRLIAALIVRISETDLAQRVARTYEPLRERSRTIRGRPVWTADFGTRRSEGVTCDFRRLSEDNLLNRLVLAGLVRASSVLAGTADAKRSVNQLFIWRSIASEMVPREEDYRRANQHITRITGHYQPALALSRALVLGFTPEDPFSRRHDPLQALDFSLPALYELFVFRFLSVVATRLSMKLDFQPTDRAAIVDASGGTYRSVRPDLVVYRSGRPISVLDAKYKSKYVSGKSNAEIPRSSKVTSADLYQLFFYQTRLQRLHNLSRPPFAVIIAPLLEGDATWDRTRRNIEWRASMGSDGPSLTVIPFPLIKALDRLGEGKSEEEIVRDFYELQEMFNYFAAV